LQTKDNQIESQKREIGSLGNQVQDLEKSSKELAEATRVALSQLKEQHSDELGRQNTKFDDACNHYKNALTAEQEKRQLKEEELGAANSAIIRIKSEAAAQTAVFEVQKNLVKELQDKNKGNQLDRDVNDNLKAQLKQLKRDAAVKRQEFERVTIEASKQFIEAVEAEMQCNEIRLILEKESIIEAAGKVSAELEITKESLGEATANGNQLDRDVNALTAQLTQYKEERDAAVDARKALLQQLERDKAEYDGKIKKLEEQLSKFTFVTRGGHFVMTPPPILRPTAYPTYDGFTNTQQYDDCVEMILATNPARLPVEASQRAWCIYFAIAGLHRVEQKISRPALADRLKFDLACSQAWKCFYCTSLLPVAFQVDHFVEWQFGGVHEAANLKATCATCHSEKNRLVIMAIHIRNEAVQATRSNKPKLVTVPNP